MCFHLFVDAVGDRSPWKEHGVKRADDQLCVGGFSAHAFLLFKISFSFEF